MQSAASRDVELEDILDTDVAILTAELLLDFTITRRRSRLVPLVHSDNLAVLQDLARLGTWISDSNGHTGVSVLSFQLESEFLGRRTSERKIVNRTLGSIDDSRESRVTSLASVETVPNVVHVRVELAVHFSSLQLHIYRLQASISVVRVLTLEHEHTQLGLIAEPQVTCFVTLAFGHVRSEARIVSNDLEVSVRH